MKKTIVAASITTLLAVASTAALAESSTSESQVPMCNGVVVVAQDPDAEKIFEKVLLSTSKKERAEAIAGELKEACEGGALVVNGGIFSQQWNKSDETMLTSCQSRTGEARAREFTISFNNTPQHTVAKFRDAGSNCAVPIGAADEVRYLYQFSHKHD